MAKTVKKQSKLSAVLTKLKPNTGKKKLLLFVVIFALIGGGYMTYKSFAATGFGIYGVDQMESIGPGGGKLSRGGQPTKGNTYVWYMDDKEAVRIKRTLEPIIWARNVRVCANVAAYQSGTQPRITIGVTEHQGALYAETVHTISSTTYRKVCSGYFEHKFAQYRMGGAVYLRNNSGVTIGSMSLEYY